MGKTNRKILKKFSDTSPNDFLGNQLDHTAPLFVLMAKKVISYKELYALVALLVLTNNGKDSFRIGSKELESYFKMGKNPTTRIIKKFSTLGILPATKNSVVIKELSLNVPRLYELMENNHEEC